MLNLHGLICEWADRHEDEEVDKMGIEELKRERRGEWHYILG